MHHTILAGSNFATRKAIFYLFQIDIAHKTLTGSKIATREYN